MCVKVLSGVPKARILRCFWSLRRCLGGMIQKLVFNGESVAFVGRWKSISALLSLHYWPMFRCFLHFSPLCAIWSHLRPHMASCGTIWNQKTRRFSLFRVVKTTCFCVVSMLVVLPVVVFGASKARVLRAFRASACLPRRWAKLAVIYCVFWSVNNAFCLS